jgi:hypothetical protein
VGVLDGAEIYIYGGRESLEDGVHVMCGNGVEEVQDLAQRVRYQGSLKIGWNARHAAWREVDGELLVCDGIGGCCCLEEAPSRIDLVQAGGEGRVGPGGS